MAENKDLSSSSSTTVHDAMFLVLTYLPLLELLSMKRVSKSLKDAIDSEILPWLKFIVIERPLSRRVTDDILLELVSKAQGKLQVLVLINCLMITDHCLFTIAKQNPHIYKLHIPGCTNLSPEGIIAAANILTKKLKTLNINGIYNVSKEHLQTLRNLVDSMQPIQPSIFYHEYRNYYSLIKQEDSPLDVDVCPKCEQVRMVFSCPPKPEGVCNSRLRKGLEFECKGCEMCIQRCVECGMCTSDDEVEDSSCGDTLCLQCWFNLPKCSFCNKPYCSQHASESVTSCSSEFICWLCHSKYV